MERNTLDRNEEINIFAIVGVKRECYGHGHYEDVKYIPRTGPYGSKGFTKFFIDREEAKNYLKENDMLSIYKIETVTLCMGGRIRLP